MVETEHGLGKPERICLEDIYDDPVDIKNASLMDMECPIYGERWVAGVLAIRAEGDIVLGEIGSLSVPNADSGGSDFPPK